MKDVISISEKAGKVFKFPNLKDKVICFIPEWERYQSEKIDAKTEDKEFLLNESFIFSFAKDRLFNENFFSFLVFRGFPKKDDNFGILPIDDIVRAGSRYLKAEKKNINILCVDYKFFTHSVLYNFIRYSDSWIFNNKSEGSKELEPLYKIFYQSSLDAQTHCFQEIEMAINKVLDKSISIEEMDRVESLSVNHLQNIYAPAFWKSVEERGYLCEYNKGNLNFDKKIKKTDIRFFYSLESLLFWELRNCLKKIQRCENCTSILPENINGKKYKGKYCPKGTESYDICNKERNRNRQKKFQKELAEY